MKAATWIAGLALTGAALLFARALASGPPRGIELGRARVTTLEPALALRLGPLPQPLVAQWFASSRAELPLGYGEVADAVEALFALLEAHGARTQVLRPDTDPEVAQHAAALGLGPFRARRIARDGWSETEVWSSLRLIVPGQGTALVRALTPELASNLQALVEAELAELAAPRRARVALSAPSGHTLLRRELDLLAEVREIDLDQDAAIPADCDLALWIAPREAGPRHVAALDAFLERGGSVVVAAGRWRARLGDGALALERTGAPLEALLEPFGVEARAEPVLEGPPEGALWANQAFTRVRSIASDQDFRPLGAQPNGTLVFGTPATLAPIPDRLAARGATFHALASTSGRCFADLRADPPGSRPTEELLEAFERGWGLRAIAPEALIALIAPGDPTRGSLVAVASAEPFGDAEFAAPGFAHRVLARALVLGLASSERRALAAVARQRPAPLPALAGSTRWLWRALAIGLAPLGLLAWALARRAPALGPPLARAILLPLAALALALAAGLASRAFGARSGLDLARGGANRLAPELVALAGRARTPLELQIALSPRSTLPEALRPAADEARALCQDLARAVDGLALVELDPDSLDAAERRRLALEERTSLAREGDALVGRRFTAAIVVRLGAARRTVRLDGAAARELPFRLALALHALELGHDVRVAFLADRERVTPAEALALYQQRGLYAPGGSDPFGAAAARLAAQGYEVIAVDPQTEFLPGLPDLVVWMQPRRDAGNGLVELARHLKGGRPALVAVQTHRVRPRVRVELGAEPALWPEPLFPDLDRLWLPALGVSLRNAIALDAQFGALEVSGTREVGGRAEATRELVSNPLVVRSTPAGRPASGLLEGVGDLALLSPSPIALDGAALARNGLHARALLTTSPRGWSLEWSGGPLPRAALEPPPLASEPLTLGVLLEGRFPGPELDPALPKRGGMHDVRSGGRLALVGCSELFRTEHLEHPDYDHARFLTQAVATLALPADVAAVLARQPSRGGFGQVEPAQRVAWRALGLGAPLALLAAALALCRRARARRWGGAA